MQGETKYLLVACSLSLLQHYYPLPWNGTNMAWISGGEDDIHITLEEPSPVDVCIYQLVVFRKLNQIHQNHCR